MFDYQKYLRNNPLLTEIKVNTPNEYTLFDKSNDQNLITGNKDRIIHFLVDLIKNDTKGAYGYKLNNDGSLSDFQELTHKITNNLEKTKERLWSDVDPKKFSNLTQRYNSGLGGDLLLKNKN